MEREQSPSKTSPKSYKLPALVRDHTINKVTSDQETTKAEDNTEQKKKIPLYVNVTAKEKRLSGEYENVTPNEEEVEVATKAVEEEIYFSSSSEDEFSEKIVTNQIDVDPVLTKQKSSQTTDFGQIKEKFKQSTKLKPSEYVGFSKLPYQVYRRSVKKGFQFNLMILGETGVGKSSLINSMFWTDIFPQNPQDQDTTTTTTTTTGEIISNKVLLQEGDVKLHLNVLSMPGFGDKINNNDCGIPIR